LLSFKTVIFRLVISLFFTLPVYLLLEQNIKKHIVDSKRERLTQKEGNLSDINADGKPELYHFHNLTSARYYLEMWADGSLLGVYAAPGQIIKHSVIMNEKEGKADSKIYFLSEAGRSIFINELSLAIKNKKLVTSAKQKLLIEKSEEGEPEFLQKKMLDINGDGENEYVFSISSTLDIRNIVAYDPKTGKITRSATDFMMITDFLPHPSKKGLLFTSYANGNVSQKNIRRMVDSYHLDTSLYSHFYSDLNSYAGILDENLEVKEIRLQREGFTSMYRIVPAALNRRKLYLGLSTFINQPDSIPQVLVLDETLSLLSKKEISLPVKQENFNKYRKEVFHVHHQDDGDRVYFLGGNDTVYELNEKPELIPVTASKNISEKSSLEFLNLDADGKSEVLLCGRQGIEIYSEGFKDRILVETGELTHLRRERYAVPSGEKTQWHFITDTNQYIILSYYLNPLYRWKIPMALCSALIIFGILTLLLFLNGRKIEKENRRLEGLVSERTREVLAQKEIADHQRELIQEKQKEIIDSITYAKYIQKAILAKEEEILEEFPESFLLYLPKDIVAGDFYFFERTASHVFYAAADCTGHGVPGALMSVVCSNALSRCVKEFGLKMPGEILDKARELVLETLRKSGEEVKDGMDISLLVKDVQNDRYYWAGANNPLWIVHSSAELTELKPDKQPVGNIEDPVPFTTHALKLQKNDILFLFTDGYADQFGGEKGKKFKYKQLAEKLKEVRHEPLKKQRDELEHTFNEWKGSLEQIDDVCIIGIKVR
jgi:serine phosphatase RsbU (regulator of sigma subunit)